MSTNHKVEIHYCVQCRWLLRAGWLAQELLSTFSDDLSEVSLKPAASGVFQIILDDDLLWCRKRDGGFPQPKELKAKVRDVISPGRDLGHIDR
jgi:selenoprotein W-related protein